MKKIKLTKETIALSLIAILSAILNFGNIGIEGTGNAYYAAAVKSMTMSFKNFFFVAFDPSGFVTIDKPPLGFWLQAISAKIFGYHGWSIILPQALAGVISVVLIYKIVKRSFGSIAGLISSLCLAVTPVFVAVSRNNTIDNVLVMVLLLACWALSVAAEKGKFKFLILSMVLIGIGFNVKMLQAYLVVPAVYITYLLANGISFKKRILHLIAGTIVLLAVSLSWALIVDAVPSGSRPYVDSSTNNTEMELIIGHNGAERISFGSQNSGGGPGVRGQMPPQFSNSNGKSGTTQNGFSGNPPLNGTGQSTGPSQSGFDWQNTNGGFQGGHRFGGNMYGGFGGGGQIGGASGLQGSFGGQTPSSITRLFSKNILSDQIVWFMPLAFLGFIAAAIKEKLKFRLDNRKKQALALWFMWLLPEFIYFSFNTGTFHSYYLTMMAPPIAALTGIGITSMWKMYKEGGWKSWFLPVSLFVNGLVQILMLSYFISTSNIVKVLLVLLIILCFGSSIALSAANLIKMNDAERKEIEGFKKALVSLALTGLLITPLVGSAAAMFTGVGSSFPAAGLELLSTGQAGRQQMNGGTNGNLDSGMVNFLLKNKTASQKYLLVVSNANEAADIIINTGEPVMAIGGFLGSDNSITLNQFIALVQKGEIRYVMAGGVRGGNGSGSAVSQIMNWVEKNGTAVPASEYSSTGTTNSQTTNGSNLNRDGRNFSMFGNRGAGQLYDLKSYTDSLTAK